MSRVIDANYQEVFLLPKALEDWVGPDHPVRFIREVVDSLDAQELGLIEADRDPGRGRPHYAARLLLKAWLYGYMNRIVSPRQLEKASREQIGLMWLLGRQEPDHNTLWRFWGANQEAVRRVFRQVVRIAVKTGTVGLVLHAVDGTKIQALCSSRGGAVWTLEKLEELLAQVEQAIAKLEEKIAANQSSEEGGEYRLPEELAGQQKLHSSIQAALQEIRHSEAQHVNLQDPQARMMPCGSGQKKLSFNAQAMVDDKSGMVVAEQVSNQAVDCFELLPLLDQAEETLGELAQDTVADKGYRTDENIGESAQQGRSVLVQLYKSEGEDAAPFHKSRFVYDPQQDCVICPRGVKLQFEKLHNNRHGWKERVFRCHEGHDCPAARQCTSNPEGRPVHIGPYEEAVQAQRELQKLEVNQKKLARRKVIVEPVFGHLKHNQGFRRWSVSGLKNVQAQWSMLCTAYNLTKLLRLWQSGQISVPKCA